MIKDKHELYEWALEIERISSKALSNKIDYKTAIKNINILCKRMREQDFGSSLTLHALAAALGIGKSILYRKLRNAGIFDSQNKPTKEYESWFVKEHLVYFSSSSHRCSYDKYFFKKQFFTELCSKI